MRKSGFQTVVLSLALVATSACNGIGAGSGLGSSSALSAARAQTAVNQAMQLRFTNWRTSGGVVQVQGVQQAGDGSSAQADLTFSNLRVNCTLVGTNYHDEWQRGTAIFKHYTDGRWVLTQIQVEGSFYFQCGSGGWEGSVPVN